MIGVLKISLTTGEQLRLLFFIPNLETFDNHALIETGMQHTGYRLSSSTTVEAAGATSTLTDTGDDNFLDQDGRRAPETQVDVLTQYYFDCIGLFGND